MEKAEIERRFFLRMTKIFLIINVTACFLGAMRERYLFILHSIFLLFFDTFFLITIFLSIRNSIEHLLKNLILFFYWIYVFLYSKLYTKNGRTDFVQ